MSRGSVPGLLIRAFSGDAGTAWLHVGDGDGLARGLRDATGGVAGVDGDGLVGGDDAGGEQTRAVDGGVRGAGEAPSRRDGGGGAVAPRGGGGIGARRPLVDGGSPVDRDAVQGGRHVGDGDGLDRGPGDATGGVAGVDGDGLVGGDDAGGQHPRAADGGVGGAGEAPGRRDGGGGAVAPRGGGGIGARRPLVDGGGPVDRDAVQGGRHVGDGDGLARGLGDAAAGVAGVDEDGLVGGDGLGGRESPRR